jgi:hypothetical protein
MLLDFNVPVKFKRSADSKVLLIEGQAIDDTVNDNMWQVPEEELPYFVAFSQNAQIRVDHGDRVEDVKGVINILHNPNLSPDGRTVVLFEGEVSGDDEFLSKIEREYVSSVSPRVLGEAHCSLCGSLSRDDKMNLVHICRGAWEIMRRPRMIELSIVSRGAYEHTKFKPVGFAAAMNANQQKVISQALKARERGSCGFCAGALTLNCLSCTSQEHFASKKAGEANHFSAEVDQHKNKEKKNPENKKMSAKQEDPASPLDAEAIKAIIEEHAKNLTEACNKSCAEAVNKAVAAAREAVKLETAAIAAKVDETIRQALKQRPAGKGAVGALNEHLGPQKLQPGLVAVPSYFKELAAAAQKKRTFDAQLAQGGME